MSKKELLLIGGGGHCKSLLSAMLTSNINVGGIIDEKSVSSHIMGVPVLGADNDLESLFSRGYTQSIISLGSVGDNKKRIDLFNMLGAIGFTFPIFTAGTSVIQSSVEIMEGTVVLERSFVNVGTKIGRNTIINSGVVVEHDVTIGGHSHVASGTVICGDVTLGNGVFVGAGTTVKQGVNVGGNTIVGAGSVIIGDLPSGVVAAGCPARVIRYIE